jgi:hypothetical protein
MPQVRRGTWVRAGETHREYLPRGSTAASMPPSVQSTRTMSHFEWPSWVSGPITKIDTDWIIGRAYLRSLTGALRSSRCPGAAGVNGESSQPFTGRPGRSAPDR